MTEYHLLITAIVFILGNFIVRQKQIKYFWVYILRCENDTYYTGYTSDITKRYQSHIDGTAKCKYTRSFKPIAIAQCWKIIGGRSLAMQIERQIKKLSRQQKNRIILKPSELSNDIRVQPVRPLQK